MNRTAWNYIVDILLGITFLGVALTGLIRVPMWTNYFSFFFRTIPNHWIIIVHDWSGIIMTLLVLVHLILHWNWIVATTKNYLRR